jgi:uncharacterized Zn finger protein (UPF0148 family)
LLAEGTAMIRLACPSCSKKLAVEDASAGTICKCPTCDNKFRVPDKVAPEPEPVPATTGISATKRSSSRDSNAQGSGSRRDKSKAAPQTNGVLLDQLEVVDDEVPVRRKSSRRRAPTPTWVNVVAAGAAILWCALLPCAYLFKAVSIVLIVIGLPVSLMSRKWHLFGIVGLSYLMAGAGFFVLHNLYGPNEGPPPEGATAAMVDAHCARLLRSSSKVEAGSWIGVEKNTDSSWIQNLRALIREAYANDAAKVWIVNPTRVDSTGVIYPDLIVVLPDDDKERDKILAWYKTVPRKTVPGDKYLYIEY